MPKSFPLVIGDSPAFVDRIQELGGHLTASSLRHVLKPQTIKEVLSQLLVRTDTLFPVRSADANPPPVFRPPMKNLAPVCIVRVLQIHLLFSWGGLLFAVCMTDAAEPNTPAPLTAEERTAIVHRTTDLTAKLQTLPTSPAKADAAVLIKGVSWGLRYDTQFTANDRRLIDRALTRAAEMIAAIGSGKPESSMRPGRSTRGFISEVDGSVQPYGLIIPAGFDPKKASRLDVVLHGSTRPVGMSELRFLARFDDDRPAPEQPFIELHPLGRVENCYRWAGETDVFEAIEDVCRRLSIDRRQIVLRGMSMGASGTWHLGLKHPDFFAALGPYCGYVDTHHFSETPIGSFVKVGVLPEHQELGLHMLDSIDYAANAGVVPAIACMGEKDIFFQAHVLMADAMRREGLTMVNLISSGTGHVVDPVTHAEQMRRIADHVASRSPSPNEIRFVTWTAKYGRCHWLEVLGLEKHYARAELHAKRSADRIIIAAPINVTRLAIHLAELNRKPSDGGIASPRVVQIGDDQIELSKDVSNKSLVFVRQDNHWKLLGQRNEVSLSGKRPGLQGPIDDAFTSPFLCVRGTGKPWNAAIQQYADASLQRFADEWHHYFRGDLPVKLDHQVTNEDVRTKNLILFGDPGSNSWIQKVLPSLPLTWTQSKVVLNGHEQPAATCVPALINPNPLPGGENRYVVLNSGHTFRESELAKLNYLLFPRWGDWALLHITDSKTPSPNAASPNTTTAKLLEELLHAGYFNESWR